MGSLTVSDVNFKLRDYLVASPLFTDVNKPNGILSFDRLDNSQKEDVIIEPLAMNYAALQEGVININTFVKNLKLPFLTGVDRSQRDSVRLQYLERLLLASFTPSSDNDDAIYFDGYSFTYQQSNIFADTDDQHYINTRIEFYAITI